MLLIAFYIVFKFKLNGEFVSQFGSKGTDGGHFQSPWGLVLSQSAMLLVCDNDNHRIQVFQDEQYCYCFG